MKMKERERERERESNNDRERAKVEGCVFCIRSCSKWMTLGMGS